MVVPQYTRHKIKSKTPRKTNPMKKKEKQQQTQHKKINATFISIDTTNITTFDAIITMAFHFAATASIFVAVTCAEQCFIVVSSNFDSIHCNLIFVIQNAIFQITSLRLNRSKLKVIKSISTVNTTITSTNYSYKFICYCQSIDRIQITLINLSIYDAISCTMLKNNDNNKA